jgi:IMP cyclohydrolase
MNDDFSALEKMTYSGRGIVIGMTPDGKSFIGYSLTGRSPSSQARKLGYNLASNMINTQVTDEEQLKKGNPALLIYPAIASIDNMIVASNGKQTLLLMDVFNRDSSNLIQESYSPVSVLLEAHKSPRIVDGIDLTSYEPDSPNFTPRISGCIDEKSGALYIVKKSIDDIRPVTNIFSFELHPGNAHMITTYKGGNEFPLVSFGKDPFRLKIKSTNADDICESIYDAIGPKNGENYRVSAAVMLKKGKKELDVAVINRFDSDE